MSDTSTRPADLAADGAGRAADSTDRPVFPRRAVITGGGERNLCLGNRLLRLPHHGGLPQKG